MSRKITATILAIFVFSASLVVIPTSTQAAAPEPSEINLIASCFSNNAAPEDYYRCRDRIKNYGASTSFKYGPLGGIAKDFPKDSRFSKEGNRITWKHQGGGAIFTDAYASFGRFIPQGNKCGKDAYNDTACFNLYHSEAGTDYALVTQQNSMGEEEIRFITRLCDPVKVTGCDAGKDRYVIAFRPVVDRAHYKIGKSPNDSERGFELNPSSMYVKATVTLKPKRDGFTPDDGGWEREKGIDYIIKAYPETPQERLENGTLKSYDPKEWFLETKDNTNVKSSEKFTEIAHLDDYNRKKAPIQAKYTIVAFMMVQSNGGVSQDLVIDNFSWWNTDITSLDFLGDISLGVDADIYMGTCTVPAGNYPKDGSPIGIGNKGDKDAKPIDCNIDMEYKGTKSKSGFVGDLIEGAINDVLQAMKGLTLKVIGFTQTLIGKNGILEGGKFLKSPGLTQAWSLVRDVANIFFLLILLIIAFTQVSRFQLEYYTLRSLLPKFVAAVILVNLSLVVSLVVVDAADVLTHAFLSLSFGGSDANSVFGAASQFDNGEAGQKALSALAWVIVMFFALIAAIVLWVLLIVRIVVVWFLVVISPIAFIADILPATKGLTKSWWTQLVKFAFMAPIAALLLAVGAVIAKTGDNSDYRATMVATMALLFAGLIPLTLGGRIMSMASGLTRAAMGRTLGFADRTSGLAALRSGFRERAERRQEVRGATIGDVLGAASAGRLGTTAEADRVRGVQRAKAQKDMSALTRPQLERLVEHGQAYERDAAATELGSRGQLDENFLDRMFSQNRLSHAGFAEAVEGAASDNPDYIDNPRLRQHIALVRRTRGIDPVTGRPIHTGFLAQEKYDSGQDFAAGMNPDEISAIAGGRWAHSGANGLSVEIKQSLPLTSESVRSLANNRLNRVLTQEHREDLYNLGQAHRAALVAGGAEDDDADQQTIEFLRLEAIGLVAGTAESFDDFTQQQQDLFLRERVMKRIDI